MPETTESASFPRPAEEVFDLVANLSNLARWDPMFEASRRLDDGPLEVGSRFEVEGSVVGRTMVLELELVEMHRPTKALYRGTGEGLATTEDIRVQPTDEGCEVTYHSRFETEDPSLLDAASQPAFVLIGQRAMRGMQRWLGG